MKKLYKKINKCRISQDKNLIEVCNFGNISLTGIFPKNAKSSIPRTPLSVVFSSKSKLLQLKHNYNPNKLFGNNYGYRSGLNNSMVTHLHKKFLKLNKVYNLKKSDEILDIGSNDGTFLNFFSNHSYRVGCDPSASKFKKFYHGDIKKISKIFDEKILNNFNRKFKIISCIAMFYDLENPVEFCKNIEKILRKDGIFHVEIAYLPDIFKKFSFDTFCQEHLTYFSLISFKYLIDQTNLKIIDFDRNSINGGSINFDLAFKDSKFKPKNSKIELLYKQETKNNFHKLKKYKNFFKKVKNNINLISNKIHNLSQEKKKIYGFGASTKGNVTLQLCNLNNKILKGIYDVNKEKFNSFTPGTNILIKNEKYMFKDKPDYLVLLIWHFTKTLKKKFKKFKIKKTKFIWLFPKIKISNKI